MACHIAPSGGGILSTYGRGLSAEVLSHWGSDKEAGFLHASLEEGEQSEEEKLNQWYFFGGDIRGVQVHKEDKIVRQGRYIPMQADFSIALQKQDFTFVGHIGEIEEEDHSWQPEITKYYLMYRPIEEVTIRAGKFVPQYGLYIPDHVLFVRSFLGLGLESDRNNIEAQYNGENWVTSVTHSQRIEIEDQTTGQIENANTAQAQFYFFDSSKIALNLWDAKSDDGQKRTISGLWGVLAMGKDVYWMTEWDQQNILRSTGELKSNVHYNKLAYSPTKGLDIFLHEEALQSDIRDGKTLIQRRGLGVQFFPRPHFDISAVWTKQITQAPSEADYAWLLLHYYL
jgi:hypothetical protein